MSLLLTSLTALMVSSAPSSATPAFAADSIPATTSPAPSSAAPPTTPTPAAAPAIQLGAAADTSLHLDMATIKRLADVNKKVEASVKTHPYDSATVVKAVQAVQSQYPGVQAPPEKMLSAQLSTNAEVVAVLKAASFTPDSYSRSMVSLQITWAVVSLTDQLMARGIAPAQVNLPQVVPANLEFVKAHIKDLTDLGFTAPNATINMPQGS